MSLKCGEAAANEFSMVAHLLEDRRQKLRSPASCSTTSPRRRTLRSPTTPRCSRWHRSSTQGRQEGTRRALKYLRELHPEYRVALLTQLSGSARAKIAKVLPATAAFCYQISFRWGSECSSLDLHRTRRRRPRFASASSICSASPALRAHRPGRRHSREGEARNRHDVAPMVARSGTRRLGPPRTQAQHHGDVLHEALHCFGNHQHAAARATPRPGATPSTCASRTTPWPSADARAPGPGSSMLTTYLRCPGQSGSAPRRSMSACARSPSACPRTSRPTSSIPSRPRRRARSSSESSPKTCRRR